MSNAIAKRNERNELAVDDETMGRVAESLVLKGDISGLSPQDRATYYVQLCRSLRLNPATQPIRYTVFQGRLIPYFTRDATDQLAALHRINREIVDGPRPMVVEGAKLVYAMCRATLPNGRVETATAMVPMPGAGAEAIANAFMKTETKSRRRATLSILGLGYTDESELDTMQGAKHVSLAHLPSDDVPPGVRADVARKGGALLAEDAGAIWDKHEHARDIKPDNAETVRSYLLSCCPPKTSVAALIRAAEAAKARRTAAEAVRDAVDTDAPIAAVVDAVREALADPPAETHPTRPEVPVEARDWNAAATDDAPPPAVDPPREPAALTDFRARCHECADLAALARAWRDCRTQLLEASKETGKAGWWVAVACVQTVTASRSKAAAEKALKAAVEALEPRPTPPTGTDAPANDAPSAATGDAREATPAPGAQASAAPQGELLGAFARLRGCNGPTHAAAHVADHLDDLPAALRAAFRARAPRIMAECWRRKVASPEAAEALIVAAIEARAQKLAS